MIDCVAISPHSTIQHSAIYFGWLGHHRFRPKVNAFRYQVFMMYLDLSELDSICKLSPFWSVKRWALAQFKRSDFYGNNNLPLEQAIRNTVLEQTGHSHTGAIRLLANWRYFGFQINPIATYYCFNKQEQLTFIVLEVTNTPWQEKQCYVLECDPSQDRQRIQFDKLMHVSPFNPMNMEYDWTCNTPGKELKLTINTQQKGDTVVNANLILERQPLTAKRLNRVILKYPFMTLKVAASIYWQALKLWVKRVPVCDHPTAK